MINKNTFIKGPRIYLRILKEQDATEKYCSWINDKEVNLHLETKSITIEELKHYINEKFKKLDCMFFGIFLKKKNIHIGNLKLEPIDFKNKTAIFGILIGEKKYWNKGYATEALNILKNFAFNNLNLNEITLGVYKKNYAAINVYKKSGFKIYKEVEDNFLMKAEN